MITYLLFIIGFGLLIKGADFLVDGASSLAKRYNVSDLVIGLTIVAFGTSMPELVVNIFASINGNTDIAIGNILGSNIANIFLILGISAMIYPLSVHKNTVWKEIPFSLLAAIVLGILANDLLIDENPFSALTRIDGLVLISFFMIFMYYIFAIAKEGGDNGDEYNILSLPKSILYVLAGLFGLILGGKWIVDGAVVIASSFGMTESLIGLTIIAVGTSLPELATSAMAAYKKNTDIAIGNVVGSNIFNIFWILGLSSILKPLPFKPSSNFDIMMTILASLFLFLFLFMGRRHMVGKVKGALFVLIYILYVMALVFWIT